MARESGADNDGDGERWGEYAKEYLDAARDDGEDEAEARATASAKLADTIKDEHDERIEEAGLSGMLSDLLNAASREINWREIAKHYVDDADWEPVSVEEEDEKDSEGGNDGTR